MRFWNLLIQLRDHGLLLGCFIKSSNARPMSSRTLNAPSGHWAGSAQRSDPTNQSIRLPQSLSRLRNDEAPPSRAIGRSDPRNNTHWIATLAAFIRNGMPQLTLFALLFSFPAHTAELLLPQQKSTFPDPYQPINLQVFITNEKAAYQDKITIVPPLNIRFTGVLKTLPEKKPSGYLYTALDIMRVNPLPRVEYQVFLGAPASAERPGDVISVYMDNALAEKILQTPEIQLVDVKAIWHGYHIYNFSRGPAIVLNNVMLPTKNRPQP